MKGRSKQSEATIRRTSHSTYRLKRLDEHPASERHPHLLVLGKRSHNALNLCALGGPALKRLVQLLLLVLVVVILVAFAAVVVLAFRPHAAAASPLLLFLFVGRPLGRPGRRVVGGGPAAAVGPVLRPRRLLSVLLGIVSPFVGLVAAASCLRFLLLHHAHSQAATVAALVLVGVAQVRLLFFQLRRREQNLVICCKRG